MLFNFFSCATDIKLNLVNRRFWNHTEEKCIFLSSSSVLFRCVSICHRHSTVPRFCNISFCSTWLWWQFANRSTWHFSRESCWPFLSCPLAGGSVKSLAWMLHNPFKRCFLDWLYIADSFPQYPRERILKRYYQQSTTQKITFSRTNMPCHAQNPEEKGDERRTDIPTVSWDQMMFSDGYHWNLEPQHRRRGRLVW